VYYHIHASILDEQFACISVVLFVTIWYKTWLAKFNKMMKRSASYRIELSLLSSHQNLAVYRHLPN